MVKGGALYYSVFISFVGALFCSLMILYTSFSRRIVQNDIGRDDLHLNVRSALVLALNDPALIPYDDSVKHTLFRDRSSEICYYKRHWGMYDIISASGKWKSYRSGKMALAGEDLREDDSMALYLADNSRYLSVSGGSRIRGTAYLPGLGIKRAGIEGRNYHGEKTVYGKIRRSERKLPEINPEKLSRIHAQLDNHGPFSSPMQPMDSYRRHGKIGNSHSHYPLVLYNKKDLVLDNISISGNVIIVSDGLVEIYPGARLEGILIFCMKAGVADNFKGSFQLFASDSIITGDHVVLEYPSVLAVFNKEQNPSYLYLGKNTNIGGGVIIHDSGKGTKNSRMILEKGSRVTGQVYCTGSIEHQGTVYGQMYCEGFHLKTPRAVYENHLLDAVISFSDLPGAFAGMALTGTKTYRTVQWLNQ